MINIWLLKHFLGLLLLLLLLLFVVIFFCVFIFCGSKLDHRTSHNLRQFVLDDGIREEDWVQCNINNIFLMYYVCLFPGFSQELLILPIMCKNSWMFKNKKARQDKTTQDMITIQFIMHFVHVVTLIFVK